MLSILAHYCNVVRVDGTQDGLNLADLADALGGMLSATDSCEYTCANGL